MTNHSGMKKILCLLLSAGLFLLCTGCAPDQKTDTSTVPCEYETRLFSTDRVHTIDVRLSDSDWEDLKSRPMDKDKYAADVTIDGETFQSVSFATKGNSSLAAVAANPDSIRYSFKINFGKIVKDQTFYGLNKLHLNNLFGDATHMKDYISYGLFRRLGVSAPLISYVWLTVNETPVGLYIAVEDMSESFRSRALNNEGELYKPETDVADNAALQLEILQGNSGEAPDGSPPPGTPPPGTVPPGTPPGSPPDSDPENTPAPAEPTPPGTPPEGSPDFFRSSYQGADLIYIDDEPASYPDIFEHDQTNATEEDCRRVIAALKGFAERRNPDEYLDTGEIIRYFAAHNFVLNGDSYTGVVPTNYYLYEKNGKLAMLPWDYNLAFGGFPMGSPLGGPGGMPGAAPGEIDESASDNAVTGLPENGPRDIPPEALAMLVNTGIFSPLTGIQEYSRPMWAWILSGENYMNQYCDVLRTLVSGYFESGEFGKETERLYSMLLPYVEKDPTSFYTAEEFTKGYETFRNFCLLRAQSIRLQLDGKLAAQTFSQNAADRVDASGLDMQSMGTPLHDTPMAQ